MSNRPRRRRAAARVAHRDAIGYGRISNLIRGCTCDPILSVVHDLEGGTRTNIAHDDWCPVVAHGNRRDIVILPPDDAA